jgi:hypothetical protein
LELIEVSNSEFLFSGHIPDYIGCSVKVITKEHLPDFAQWTKELANTIREELKDEEANAFNAKLGCAE